MTDTWAKRNWPAVALSVFFVIMVVGLVVSLSNAVWIYAFLLGGLGLLGTAAAMMIEFYWGGRDS